ncbi:MAG: helix-turn-helix transcriptional regulator [Clostridia bacterium]|nr:helix-turn-helix transcriptional regulator [Clostridia bacterium]
MVLSFSPAPEFRTCAIKRFKPDELHVTRRHSRSVLILMAEGILRFREDGQNIELQAGEYYIQRAGLLQEGIELGDSPVYFYLEFLGASYSEEEENGLPLRGRFQPSAIARYPQRLEEAYHTHKADPFLLNSYMNRIFSVLLETAPQRDEQAQIAELIRSDIEARYVEQITLEELSHRFGYDKDYIIRLYRRRWGITPHQHLLELRIEHAGWLLENTDFSVHAVADAVGYKDLPSFWRAFRKIMGVSPSEYRNLHG